MNEVRYRELLVREANTIITELELEELNLLRQLEDVIARQAALAAEVTAVVAEPEAAPVV